MSHISSVQLSRKISCEIICFLHIFCSSVSKLLVKSFISLVHKYLNNSSHYFIRCFHLFLLLVVQKKSFNMEFYPTPQSGGVVTGGAVISPMNGCNTCCSKPCKERSNVISCETIAIHTITNIILWSFAALVIGRTPNDPYSIAGLNPNQDGQNQGTGTTPQWLYTPPQAFGQSSYGSPTASPTVTGGRSPTMSPLQQNVDLGGNALREAANLCFGIASVIPSIILLMRAASNTVINHPRTCKSSFNIAVFETFWLTFAWAATLAGMVSVGLGYEPKTGWAIFSVCIFAIIGYAVCYTYQAYEEDCENGGPCCQVYFNPLSDAD